MDRKDRMSWSASSAHTASLTRFLVPAGSMTDIKDSASSRPTDQEEQDLAELYRRSLGFMGQASFAQDAQTKDLIWIAAVMIRAQYAIRSPGSRHKAKCGKPNRSRIARMVAARSRAPYDPTRLPPKRSPAALPGSTWAHCSLQGHLAQKKNSIARNARKETKRAAAPHAGDLRNMATTPTVKAEATSKRLVRP